jgi:hypothetical protein
MLKYGALEPMRVGGVRSLVVLFPRRFDMQRNVAIGVALALLAAATSIRAADISSGMAPGEKVGTFSATKCAGVDDGIAVGKSLCYT